MNSRKASRTVKTLLDSTSDPEAAIHQLRRQKVETKFFHTRTKLLPKSMKRVKVALTQKIVKKIKEAEEGEKKGELERELGKMKALDHVKLADWTFKTQIFKNEEYLQSKLKELGMSVPLSDEEFAFEGMIDKVMSVKCYQDAVKGCRADLNLFMKKLFHEEAKEISSEKAVVKEVVPRERKMKAPLSGDKSFFMDSLNADDSEASGTDDSDRSVTEGFDGRVAFTDDEEEEAAYGGYLDSDNSDPESTNKPKKKKNRLGQMARRRLAEKMYGKEAKHIKTGGLTVQQREELRKQKSQQRKERNARIKKEVAKRNNSNTNSNTSISITNNNNTESKPVKIDPNMHPSWAAKLQQQAKIQQASFQGQKIKFDD